MTTEQQTPSDDQFAEGLDHVMQSRLEKLKQIRETGTKPYAYRYNRSHTISETLNNFQSLETSEAEIRLAGRLMSIRLMGKAAFAHILDENTKMQIYIRRDSVSENKWELFRLLDIGDIIGVEGTLFITRTGEQSLKLTDFTLLTKNIRPLPSVKEREGEVWNRWADKEERYRFRSIDLLVNRGSRKVFQQRSRIITEIRKFMDELDFIEVETPILQPIYGGATAKPFTTYHNTLDRKLYLRIADELYLKRLIAGGFNRVYEIAKDFRNEGIDSRHSPEFTMFECYCAYEDYTFCMDLLERLLPHLSKTLHSSTQLKWGDLNIDLTPPYRRETMAELIMEKCGIEILGRDKDSLANDVAECGVEIDASWTIGKLIDELFSEKVEPELINPTFVMDYPLELSPLAKRHRDNPALVERFELFIGGHEIANSFSELNDPLDQRKRFQDQAQLLSGGDEEAHPVDEDFLQVLEIGMPPTAGLGVGIDRLVMLLADCRSIRDVILFPTLRQKA